VTSASILIAAVFILLFGKLSDLYGRKRFFLLGNAIFTIGALLAGVSWSGNVIVAARVIQGLGGSMIFSISIAVVASGFPPGERSRAIGQMLSMVIALLVFSLIIGNFRINPEAYPELQQSVTVGFGIFFVLGIIWIWTSYARGDRLGGERGSDRLGTKMPLLPTSVRHPISLGRVQEVL
jgi:MFS family permease